MEMYFLLHIRMLQLALFAYSAEDYEIKKENSWEIPVDVSAKASLMLGRTS